MSQPPVRFPIGIADFRTVREGGFYYVDKTALIDEVIAESTQVMLTGLLRISTDSYFSGLNLGVYRRPGSAGAGAPAAPLAGAREARSWEVLPPMIRSEVPCTP